ncbi:PREDICTED: uncharacterized protein LOC101299922 [Fragaria vesca subsp. vesca]
MKLSAVRLKPRIPSSVVPDRYRRRPSLGFTAACKLSPNKLVLGFIYKSALAHDHDPSLTERSESLTGICSSMAAPQLPPWSHQWSPPWLRQKRLMRSSPGIWRDIKLNILISQPNSLTFTMILWSFPLNMSQTWRRLSSLRNSLKWIWNPTQILLKHTAVMSRNVLTRDPALPILTT